MNDRHNSDTYTVFTAASVPEVMFDSSEPPSGDDMKKNFKKPIMNTKKVGYIMLQALCVSSQ